METLKLHVARRAERQMDEILEYIAMDNPEAAAKISEHIEDLLEKVKVFPEMGKLVYEDLAYREVFAYPCRLIYKRIGNVLWLVAVLRMEQLLRKAMLDS